MKETSFDFGHHFPNGSSNLWMNIFLQDTVHSHFFLVLTKTRMPTPEYIYIYKWYTNVYHKDERHMIPCSWAWHDMPIPKPQVFAPNGYKIGFFTLTFGCVFICNLGWYICGCSNVWWFFPVMFSSFFARQKRNCLKLQTWSYNACVSISVYVMIPSLFWWTSSGSPRSSRRRFGCRWC